MRVLIADADEALLEILQSFLWDRGHEVEVAGNGLECLTMLREFSPDALVLDRDLLWGGGEGVLAHMCEDLGLAGVPVILVTDEDMAHRADGHVVSWLRKPYRLSDLLAQIDSISRSTGSSTMRMRCDCSVPHRSMTTHF